MLRWEDRMSDTIRWCFTHDERPHWADGTVCYRIESDQRECDVGDALVIRAPIDYEAAAKVLWDDDFVHSTVHDIARAVVDAALGGNE